MLVQSILAIMPCRTILDNEGIVVVMKKDASFRTFTDIWEATGDEPPDVKFLAEDTIEHQEGNGREATKVAMVETVGAKVERPLVCITSDVASLMTDEVLERLRKSARILFSIDLIILEPDDKSN
ncbi:hypothetical protein Adt_05854 [Abeliophyllum distichum]|uniref:Uncharacterized protein n=1 Tax=Abeliophyllum distichum TaxID=126358 RepID=A0ABD1V7G2_9LAMI